MKLLLSELDGTTFEEEWSGPLPPSIWVQLRPSFSLPLDGMPFKRREFKLVGVSGEVAFYDVNVANLEEFK